MHLNKANLIKLQNNWLWLFCHLGNIKFAITFCWIENFTNCYLPWIQMLFLMPLDPYKLFLTLAVWTVSDVLEWVRINLIPRLWDGGARDYQTHPVCPLYLSVWKFSPETQGSCVPHKLVLVCTEWLLSTLFMEELPIFSHTWHETKSLQRKKKKSVE